MKRKATQSFPIPQKYQYNKITGLQKPEPMPLGGQRTPSPWLWSMRGDYRTSSRYPKSVVDPVGASYARKPNMKDSELLITYYNAMLCGFSMMICQQSIPKSNAPIFYRFLKLFDPDPLKAVRGLQKKFRDGTADDVQMEVVLVFLETASKFKGIGSFSSYINKYFPFNLRDRLERGSGDPMLNLPLYSSVNDYVLDSDGNEIIDHRTPSRPQDQGDES